MDGYNAGASTNISQVQAQRISSVEPIDHSMQNKFKVSTKSKPMDGFMNQNPMGQQVKMGARDAPPANMISPRDPPIGMNYLRDDMMGSNNARHLQDSNPFNKTDNMDPSIGMRTVSIEQQDRKLTTQLSPSSNNGLHNKPKPQNKKIKKSSPIKRKFTHFGRNYDKNQQLLAQMTPTEE